MCVGIGRDTAILMLEHALQLEVHAMTGWRGKFRDQRRPMVCMERIIESVLSKDLINLSFSNPWNFYLAKNIGSPSQSNLSCVGNCPQGELYHALSEVT
jgi:hypothetical protein